MTEIKIKEHDLYVIIKDLMEEALSIDRPNKVKICNFVVDLVENGGHITNAAMAAGYGPKKTKDGRIYTEAERRKVAGSEGSRLLENTGISGLYEKLMWHRCVSNTFTKSFSREHVIYILYQIAINTLEKNPRQAIMALREASTLAGHYQIAEKTPGDISEEDQHELIQSREIIEKVYKVKLSQIG